MTVEDLRRMLLQYPDDALVVVASDSEGNGYSPLANSWRGFYAAATTWSGDAYDERDIEECDLDQSRMVVAVVLTPTN